MTEVLAEYFEEVWASDIHPYGYEFCDVHDFLGSSVRVSCSCDWIITNPPFNRAAEFVNQALRFAKRGVAMLCRSQFAEGQERYRTLFRDRPPQLTAQFVERVPMHRGRWVVNGKSATAYKWFVWLSDPLPEWQHTREIWIPPSRSLLTAPDDWIRFGGCMDLPKTHPAMEMMEAA